MLLFFSRLSGDDGRQFFPLIIKHFSRLGKAFQVRTSYKICMFYHLWLCYVLVWNLALLCVCILPSPHFFIYTCLCGQTHISSENEELSQAALQALGFCVFNSSIVSGIPGKLWYEVMVSNAGLGYLHAFFVVLKGLSFDSFLANFAEEILLVLCALLIKSMDKNTCTRALWVISKQNFPSEIIAKKVSNHKAFCRL